MTQTRTLLAAFAALALGATPAFAQSDTVTTQTPPAPNAQSFTPQPQASVPAGAATSVTPRPGDGVATTATSPRAAPVAGGFGTRG